MSGTIFGLIGGAMLGMIAAGALVELGELALRRWRQRKGGES